MKQAEVEHREIDAKRRRNVGDMQSCERRRWVRVAGLGRYRETGRSGWVSRLVADGTGGVGSESEDGRTGALR